MKKLCSFLLIIVASMLIFAVPTDAATTNDESKNAKIISASKVWYKYIKKKASGYGISSSKLYSFSKQDCFWFVNGVLRNCKSKKIK